MGETIAVQNNTRQIVPININGSIVAELRARAVTHVPLHAWNKFLKRAHVRTMLSSGALIVDGSAGEVAAPVHVPPDDTPVEVVRKPFDDAELDELADGELDDGEG